MSEIIERQVYSSLASIRREPPQSPTDDENDDDDDDDSRGQAAEQKSPGAGFSQSSSSSWSSFVVGRSLVGMSQKIERAALLLFSFYSA